MNYDQKELQMGTAIEGEHTADDRLAMKIAMDHLREDPHYYTKLKAAGLEQEGALTNAERGMDECGADVAIIKIGAVAPQAGATGQKSLTSSNLGSGTPKPLTSDKLEAPKGDNHGGQIEQTPTSAGKAEPSRSSKNSTDYARKTPTMGGMSNCNADATDFFGGQISKALNTEIPRKMEQIPANIYEGGAQLKKSE